MIHMKYTNVTFVVCNVQCQHSVLATGLEVRSLIASQQGGVDTRYTLLLRLHMSDDCFVQYAAIVARSVIGKGHNPYWQLFTDRVLIATNSFSTTHKTSH